MFIWVLILIIHLSMKLFSLHWHTTWKKANLYTLQLLQLVFKLGILLFKPVMLLQQWPRFLRIILTPFTSSRLWWCMTDWEIGCKARSSLIIYLRCRNRSSRGGTDSCTGTRRRWCTTYFPNSKWQKLFPSPNNINALNRKHVHAKKHVSNVILHGKTGKKVMTRALYFNTLDKRKFL